MVWFFSKGRARVRLETRYDEDTLGYVLDIAWPDQPEQTERFADLESFQHRVTALEAQLENEQWTQVGGPEILPHGWRGPL